MTSIPSKHKIASAVILIAVIAAGAVPTLRAQGRLPHQGGIDPADSLSTPPPSGSVLSPNASAPATDDSLAQPLAPGMADDSDSQPPPLVGTIDGNDYVAPTGTYRIRVPVYPMLGGQVNDTENVVTFQDAYGDHSSIGAFPLDTDMRVQKIKAGHKEFLVWFFQNYIQADFQRSFPGTTAMPDARYNSATQGGALFTQLLIPDGSVYTERVFLFPQHPPPVAKRGNLVFERDGFVYVLSMELTERIFQHDTWKKTDAEEETILRGRLYDLLSNMVFTKAKTGGAPPPAPAPASTGTTAPAATLPTVTFPPPATTGTAGAAK